MDRRHSTRALAAAVLALSLGACEDIPSTAPSRAAPAGQASRTLSASGVTLVSNAVKYRDAGAKPATGRAGSAALQALALMGSDGRTELEFGPVPADPSRGWVAGRMSHAQIKALDADGKPMFVRNLNELDPFTHRMEFGTLMRGQALQVQANVTGIDPHRTDVVTVTERVKLRPRIAVDVAMPPEVTAYQPVPIHATVTETNGDVGALVDCLLEVDGWTEDHLFYAWVDAGDAVTCAFTYRFPPGAHQVRVRVGGIIPEPWDRSGTESPVLQVQATSAPREFTYFAGAGTSQTRTVGNDTWSWRDLTSGTSGEFRSDWTETGEVEWALMSGYSENPVAGGEVSIEVLETSGGRVVHSDAWTQWGQGCNVRYDGNMVFYYCGVEYWSWDDVRYASFYYERGAGTVTYHSRTHVREWDDVTGDELYYYHWNDESVRDRGPLAGYGDDFRIRIRLTSGDETLTADSEFPLVRTEDVSRYSECYDDSWELYFSRRCFSTETHSIRRTGSDTNSGG